MTHVCFYCPLPLIIKIVKRAIELGAREERWGYTQSDPTRHAMQFVFADQQNSDLFFNEGSRWIGEWERENKSDNE